ncbi:MAG: CocE/NonD family hydrolase [bacterium]|nr:CocE/NonD family hydrolase [Candidatus Kapabacteria bacterium]
MIRTNVIIAALLFMSHVAIAQVRFEAISIPTRDGKTLAADLYTTDKSAKRPTILVQTPYNKSYYRFAVNIPAQAGASMFPWDSANYNYVVLDWRGFSGSRDAAVTGYDRGLDGYDAVEWIATQSWSNGKVGTWGTSALGMIQFQTARHHPPHLVCAVPLAKDFKTKYTDFYYGGEYRKEHVESLETLGLASSSAILSRPTYDATWKVVERNSDYADEIEIPMLLISGWYDHYPDDIIRAFDDLRTNSAADVRGLHRLIMGPWIHEGIGEAQQGALSYPNAAGVPDSIALQFFDHFMRDIDNGYVSRPRVQYFQMGSDEWRSTDSWNTLATNADTADYFLNIGGALTPTAGASGGAPFTYNPRNPSPTIGGPRLVPFGDSVSVGPQDQRPVQARGDLLIFETSVLQRELSINGAPAIELFVSSNREDTDISVRLCDVYPDGRAMLVTQGIVRMRFRDGLSPGDTSRMQQGFVYRAHVPMQNLAMTWRTGHRLRLLISGSNFPQFERNLNTGGALYGGNDTLVAFDTIHTGVHPSRIRLPLANAVGGVEQATSVGHDVTIAPNPIHDDALVRLVLQSPQLVTVSITDLLGRTIRTIDGGRLDAGVHVLTINADELVHGVYICRVVIGDSVRCVTLVR